MESKGSVVVKFLLDENVDPAIRDELRRLNPAIEIIKIGDPGVPPRGTLDPRILMWCEEHNFILVTNDRTWGLYDAWVDKYDKNLKLPTRELLDRFLAIRADREAASELQVKREN